MKNEIVVNLADTSPASTTLTNHLPVGTRIISIFGETANTEDGQDVFTGFNAEGYISAILLGQEHCYAVDFPLGVSVFISPMELADSSLYQVIRRVIAYVQPHASNNDGECYFEVTEQLLNGWSLRDIQHWADGDYRNWLLIKGVPEHGENVKVADTIRTFFGVTELTDITEEMLLVKRAECKHKPGVPVGKFYSVHIYAVVRVKVPVVEAKSQSEAIKKAESLTDLHSMFRKGDSREFSDDIDCFLVDEIGDEGFTHSRWYKKDGVTPLYRNQVTNRDLHHYIVTLCENIEGTETIVFECQAEDIHHAIQQAENAYSNAKVVGAMLKLG